ncbi:OsmC family protein [Streptomyces sp. NPDC001220]
MRNNFNTSAFSELAFEIRDDPAEGWFSYVGKASFSPGRGLSARIGPAMFGTLKSARKYSFAVHDYLVGHDFCDGEGGCELSPVELALTGLGSCSMKTLIGGGSARGVTFESVEMLAALNERGTIEAPTHNETRYRVDCLFQVGTSSEQSLLMEMLEQVQEYSPNHRTLTDQIPLAVNYQGDDLRQDVEKTDATSATPLMSPAVERRLAWITGPQFDSWTPGRTSTSHSFIDSPKQLTGADWGPNAQEYLLMGLSADIAAYLNYFTVKELGGSQAWDITSTARVDAAGMLDTGESLVGLQDTACHISYRGNESARPETLRTIVAKAVKSSIVRSLISNPTPVDVSLKSGYDDAPARSIGRRAS